MILMIDHILDADGQAALLDDLDMVRWLDGSGTAGHTARAVKQNIQADLSGRVGLKVRDRVLSALQAHPVLCAAAQPARFSRPLISRTEAGGGYGTHIDNPFMDSGDRLLRTDLSYTLFLSDPETYIGGELTIERPEGQRSFKPAKGTLILYPSSYLHAVKPVTQGVRLACVGWIESRVKQASRREILFDLENRAVTLAGTHDAQSPESLTLAKVIANLKRDFS